MLKAFWSMNKNKSVLKDTPKMIGQFGQFYENPTKRLLKNGCFSEIPALLAHYQPKTILLVLGERSFKISDYYSKLLGFLDGYLVIETTPVSANPKQEFLQREIDRLKSFSYDLVLAIGGGSVLDAAKLFAVLPKQDQTDLDDYIEGNIRPSVEPVILIELPTTSGTGSEVTPFVSFETREKKKITLTFPHFFPTVALIDPELSYSMPAYVTASTGFDALSQAIESFWAVNATPFSRTHALRALELANSFLEQAVRENNNVHARFGMSLASCEAGLAISQTKTTAVHSVSYPITTHFGVVHGHACALTLSSFIRFNAFVLKEEGRPLLNILKVASYEAFAGKVDDLMKRVGLQMKLSELGIQKEGIDLIVRDGFRPDRIKNNPREVTPEALRTMLIKLF